MPWSVATEWSAVEVPERVQDLRGGDGGASDVRDAAAGSARSGRAARAAGDRAGCAARACCPTRPAGDHAGRAFRSGRTARSTGNGAAGATGSGSATRSARDLASGPTRSGSAEIRARRAVGVDARRRWRSRLSHRDRCECHRSRGSACKEHWGEKFCHHDSRLPTTPGSQNHPAILFSCDTGHIDSRFTDFRGPDRCASSPGSSRAYNRRRATPSAP